MSEIYKLETYSSFGSVVATGKFKQQPADFKVVEILSFTLTGEGDHVYLFIEKTACNTDWVAAELAKLTGLKPVDVGYAGKKDRHAVTRQWFSLHMPNQQEPDWAELPNEITVLEKTRHNKKLRTGSIEKNVFDLAVCDVSGDEAEIERRLQLIKSRGFPNYFGPQRFGNQCANVYKLVGTIKGRRRMSKTQRSMCISSARSYLFNQILNKRVRQGNWNQAISGDVMALQGSRSIFVPDEALAQTIVNRIAVHDIHPAAVMWGRGEIKTTLQAREIENNVIDAYPDLIAALNKAGVDMAYRSMRVVVPDLTWVLKNNRLTLHFSLDSGAYATALLNEFILLSS